MYQDLYNYLIDDKIEIYENDTLLIKFQKILLKYKRIISIILLIILLTIGYLCKIHELFLNSNSNIHDTCILNGGYKSVYASKIKHSASSAASSVKSGIINAPSNLKNFGARRAEDAKILAPWAYGILYSVAISMLTFLIFVPAIGFIIVGLICYVLLKGKISYIKSL